MLRHVDVAALEACGETFAHLSAFGGSVGVAD